ncbi:hypothetical protein GCM10027194_34250 [Thalassiella azotivora]
MTSQGDSSAEVPDGRRSRWDEHNRRRREAFVDSAVRAVRRHGADVGMDAIAAEAGVSKTVLYRHFADKAELHAAVLDRIAEHVVVPRLREALDADLPVIEKVRSVVETYVSLITADPAMYRFVVEQRGGGDFVAATEEVVASAVAELASALLEASGRDRDAAETWAFAVVGAVQLATRRWMDTHQEPTAADAASPGAQRLVHDLVRFVQGGLDEVLGLQPQT